VEVVEHRNVIRSYLDQKVVCYNVIEFISIQCAHSSPPNSLWTFIVGFTVSCAAACVATLRLFPKAAAIRYLPFSTILIYFLGFWTTFWCSSYLVGWGSCYVKTGPGDRHPIATSYASQGLRL
jgi:hypothetical protein